jgi:hypothetical protein
VQNHPANPGQFKFRKLLPPFREGGEGLKYGEIKNSQGDLIIVLI